MKLIWNKDSNAYEAAAKAIFQKYKDVNESIVVQLRLKYNNEKEYDDITTLLLNDGFDWCHPNWIWEIDWWEGQKDVELIAAAPISSIDLRENFGFEPNENCIGEE